MAYSKDIHHSYKYIQEYIILNCILLTIWLVSERQIISEKIINDQSSLPIVGKLKIIQGKKIYFTSQVSPSHAPPVVLQTQCLSLLEQEETPFDSPLKFPFQIPPALVVS